MSARLVEAIVGVAVLVSAGILAAMFAVPFVGLAPVSAPAATSSPGATVVVEPSADPEIPPLGLYQLRGAFDFNGRCLGLDLGPEAYPLAPGAVGQGTVLWWDSPVTDQGNPAICQSRTGDLTDVEATVTRVADEDDPDGPPTGYAVRFHLPFGTDGGVIDAEILILAAQSTQQLVQALDMTTSGSGLVFERVESIAPPLEPSPSGA